MLELLTIRHAQASFDADDYDQLSTRGELQAARLGAFLAADHGLGFEVVVVGAMNRHQQTWAAIEQAYGAQSRPLPEAIIDPAFNEFDHGAVLSAFLKKYPEHPASHRGRMPDKSDRSGIAQFIMSALQAWSQGLLEDELDEGWFGFQRRVRQGIAELFKTHAGRERVMLVSSGGVIAQIAGHALAVPDARLIDFNLSLMNTGMSTFHWRGASLHLQNWNTLPHLVGVEGRALHTYF
ncbi:MAG: histidine phosphatase family protein [Ahniella sp.]|nr:histidine phosphatase family protein [Ahniella sp.]